MRDNIVHRTEEISRLRTQNEAYFILVNVATFNNGVIRYLSVLNSITQRRIRIYSVIIYMVMLLFFTDVYLFNIFLIPYCLLIPWPFPDMTIVSHLDFCQPFLTGVLELYFCTLSSSSVFFHTVARGLFDGKPSHINPLLKTP